MIESRDPCTSYSCRDAACRYPMDQNMLRPLFFQLNQLVLMFLKQCPMWPADPVFVRVSWGYFDVFDDVSEEFYIEIHPLTLRSKRLFSVEMLYLLMLTFMHTVSKIGTTICLLRPSKDSSYPSRPFTPSPYTSAGWGSAEEMGVIHSSKNIDFSVIRGISYRLDSFALHHDHDVIL